MVDEKRRVVLVTGASAGIGLAVAVRTAEAGHRTVATMRDVSREDTLRGSAQRVGVSVDVRQLDVTDQRSVDDCVQDVVAGYGRIDAVVNCAGIGRIGTVAADPVDDFRTVMETNFFGTVRVVRAVLPHLITNRGRVITVTGLAGLVGQPLQEAYSASKFAVEGMMESFAPLASKLGVSVSLIVPGAVHSGVPLQLHAELQNPREELQPYSELVRGCLTRNTKEMGAAEPPRAVADSVVATLSARRPPFRVATAPLAIRTARTKLVDLDGALIQRMTTNWLR